MSVPAKTAPDLDSHLLEIKDLYKEFPLTSGLLEQLQF